MGFTVNGEPVADAMLAAETESLLARFRQLSPEQLAQFGFQEGSMEQRAREWARENVIERILMRQEALRDPEPIPEETLEKAEEAMYKRFGGREKFAESGMTAETIRAEAEATVKLDRLLGRITSQSKRRRPATWPHAIATRKNAGRRASRCMRRTSSSTSTNRSAKKKARKAIDEAKAEIDGGATFEEVADKASDCPGNGGDLGWFGRGKMVDEFENVVFAMEPGHVSDVFRSVFATSPS
ncbi:MAG: peptidylprolyl isomerase [Bryobacterales bacterium]